jgi:dTMP kinase
LATIWKGSPLRGKFITFEGGEGSGKSTHAAMLAKRLKSFGVGVELTREPGGSPGAEIIRHVLLSGAAKAFGAEAEAILFAAARSDHLRTRIEPALKRGKWVISDRFADSTRVYQGALGRVDAKLIRLLEQSTVGEVKPDVTFILDLPAEVGLARASKRRGKDKADRFEQEPPEFHEKLRKAYLALARSEPKRCVVIDASKSKEDVAERIWKVVNQRLEPATAGVFVEDAV